MPRPSERYKKIKEEMNNKVEKVLPKKEEELSHSIYDVVTTEDNKYQVVKVSYSPITGESEFEKTDKVFDSASRADYNCNELNSAERVKRIREKK